MRDIRRILVVDDDEEFLRGVCRSLNNMDLKVTTYQATGVKAATSVLHEHPVDLVLTDYMLKDGTAQNVIGAVVTTRPMPLVVVMSGLAAAADGFCLAQRGVVAFLAKPFSGGQLRGAIEKASSYRFEAPLLAASCVGNMTINGFTGPVRQIMRKQAYALAKGNKSRAARILGVQRQSLG